MIETIISGHCLAASIKVAVIVCGFVAILLLQALQQAVIVAVCICKGQPWKNALSVGMKQKMKKTNRLNI